MFNDLFNPQSPLFVADLFECILECLVISHPQRPGKEERRTLAVLARTCRAFSEPSLDILWQRLGSLVPLLRCFAGVPDEIRANTPPSALEWSIINRYSPRIRDLTLGDEPLSLHFVQHIGFVLPNLRIFRWKSPLARGFEIGPDFSPDSFRSVSSLPTPNLVTIEAQFSHQGDPNYQLFLDSYPLLSPSLKSIRISFVLEIQDHITVSPALCRALCGNANWQHVELSPPINAAIVKHLGACSNLRTVSLALAPHIAGPDEAYFGQDTPFRGVSEVSFVLWDSLDVVTRLLRPRDQAFNTFSVILHPKIVERDVSALFRAVSSPRHIRSLKSLNFIASCALDISPSDRDRHHLPLSYDTFRPLASLEHLRTLKIDLSHPVSLSDDEFAQLVQHWPLLERLRMTWTPEEHPASSITLRGLVSLLASCRQLHTMYLTLDARHVPAAGTYEDVCSPSVIHSIMFHNSPLEHADSVATFLLKCAPYVAGVYASFAWGSPRGNSTSIAAMTNKSKDSEYRRLWLEVGSRVRHRTSARRA